MINLDTRTFLTAAACFRYCNRRVPYHPSPAIKEEEEDAPDDDGLLLGIFDDVFEFQPSTITVLTAAPKTLDAVRNN